MSVDMDNCESVEPLAAVEVSSSKPSEIFESGNPEKKDMIDASLLPPDHPLLQRFQQTLKEHLLRVKAQLTDDIDELKHNIKKKEKECEEVGARLYDNQKKIERQNTILEEYAKNIEETVEKRIKEEAQRDSLKKEYEEKHAAFKERKLKHNKQLVELGHLQELENNIRKWANEYETELKSSKRVVSKDAQLQKEKAEEKYKADLMLYNLQVELKKSEEESQGLAQQIIEQTELNNTLKSSLSDANADLEALQQEQKRITQSWGEVIVAIQHRDKVLHQTREMVQKQEEELKLTTMSIEATNKQIAKAKEKSDRLEASESRLNKIQASLKKEVDKQSKILEKLDMELEELPKILEQTEKDYQEAKKEGNQLTIELNAIQKQLEKQYAIKSDLEASILKAAQDLLLCDKATQNRIKVLKEHQEIRRKMEDELQKVETQVSDTLLKLEHQKGVILNLHEEGDALRAKLKDRNDEFDALKKDIKALEHQMALKSKEIDKLSKELDDLKKKNEGSELSPTELKIKNLKIAIKETEQKIKEQQQIWLTLQGHVVRLSEKRNKQLNDIQVARKQLMIINQKSLKIDNQMEEAEKKDEEVLREIQSYTTKLELLSAKCYKNKKQHDSTELECETEISDLLQKLKDDELKVLQLEQKTIDLTNDIDHHKNIVLECHREALSWETKYKLLDETLRWRRKESSLESEIGQMKAEIHRMEIRYKELKRAQQKLMLDLDHTVMHREKIFVAASNREKMKGTHSRSKTNIQQKINDVKSKLKQVNNNIAAAEKQLKELSKEHAELEEAKANIQKTNEEETNQNELIKNEIEQGVLLKCQNLETIVRKQNRAKAYRKLIAAGNSQPKLTKSEASIELNMQKQLEINNHLSEVAETLLAEFPQKKMILTRIVQTLKD